MSLYLLGQPSATEAAAARAAAIEGFWKKFTEVLGGFGKAVGYAALGPAFSTFLQRQEPSYRDVVISRNNRLIERGYGDPNTYNPDLWAENWKSVFYPMQRPESVNAVVPVFDFNRCTCNAALSAPTMWALSYISDVLRGVHGYSTNEVNRALVPQSQSSVAYGVFQQPYKQPDVFKTADGKVKVDYAPSQKAANTGEARIVYVVNNEQRPLVDQTIGMQYVA